MGISIKLDQSNKPTYLPLIAYIDGHPQRSKTVFLTGDFGIFTFGLRFILSVALIIDSVRIMKNRFAVLQL
jgi:hypothetical protein